MSGKGIGFLTRKSWSTSNPRNIQAKLEAEQRERLKHKENKEFVIFEKGKIETIKQPGKSKTLRAVLQKQKSDIKSKKKPPKIVVDPIKKVTAKKFKRRRKKKKKKVRLRHEAGNPGEKDDDHSLMCD